MVETLANDRIKFERISVCCGSAPERTFGGCCVNLCDTSARASCPMILENFGNLVSAKETHREEIQKVLEKALKGESLQAATS